MEDALSSSLATLASLTAGLGSNPGNEQLEQLRSVCTGILTSAKGQPPGLAQQKRLWEAAAALWVSLSGRLAQPSPAAHQAITLPAERQHRCGSRPD